MTVERSCRLQARSAFLAININYIISRVFVAELLTWFYYFPWNKFIVFFIFNKTKIFLCSKAFQSVQTYATVLNVRNLGITYVYTCVHIQSTNDNKNNNNNLAFAINLPLHSPPNAPHTCVRTHTHAYPMTVNPLTEL